MTMKTFPFTASLDSIANHVTTLLGYLSTGNAALPELLSGTHGSARTIRRHIFEHLNIEGYVKSEFDQIKGALYSSGLKPVTSDTINNISSYIYKQSRKHSSNWKCRSKEQEEDCKTIGELLEEYKPKAEKKFDARLGFYDPSRISPWPGEHTPYGIAHKEKKYSEATGWYEVGGPEDPDIVRRNLKHISTQRAIRIEAPQSTREVFTGKLHANNVCTDKTKAVDRLRGIAWKFQNRKTMVGTLDDVAKALFDIADILDPEI